MTETVSLGTESEFSLQKKQPFKKKSHIKSPVIEINTIWPCIFEGHTQTVKSYCSAKQSSLISNFYWDIFFKTEARRGTKGFDALYVTGSSEIVETAH